MLERADFEDRLARADVLGEFRLLRLAVGVDDLDRFAHHAHEWMEHHEAGAVGDEIRERRSGGGELDGALGIAFDQRRVADALRLVLASRGICDRET